MDGPRRKASKANNFIGFHDPRVIRLCRACCAFRASYYTVYRLDSNYIFSQYLALVHLISSWLFWAEMGHVALPKWLKNRFKPVWQGRQLALRAYCPNLYTDLYFQHLIHRPFCCRADKNKAKINHK